MEPLLVKRLHLDSRDGLVVGIEVEECEDDEKAPNQSGKM